MIFYALTGYYKTLSKLGYYRYDDVFRILILCFIRDFVFQDYRGILSREDYYEIEQALNCLFGTNCLIPYPDYLKMEKLHLGSMTELAQRVSNLEDTDVLKQFDADGTGDSDIIILAEED